MLPLRRTALRLLSCPSTSFFAKSRSINTVSPSALRVTCKPASITFQRRWATGEAEAKQEQEDAPISRLQATPQEEVENAINSDNSAELESTPQPVARPAQAPESDETFESAVNTANEVTSKTFTAVKNAAGQAYDRAAERVGAATGYGGRRERSRESVNNEPKPTIYIGNLFFDVTENDLVKELARFGTITKCRLMRDSRGLSKGFGYVDFETTASATKAIETLNQQLFEGRRLAVQYAAFETKTIEASRVRPERSSKPLNPPSNTLFIGNMSFEMTDRDLNNLFRGIRNVIDVRVAIDRRTGQPRGFAHADFVDVKSAMEAMKVLEGKETYGRKLRLDYSYGPGNSPRNSGNPPSESEDI